MFAEVAITLVLMTDMAPPADKPPAWLLWGPIVAQSLDVTTSLIGRERGYRETNPLLRSSATIVVLKLSSGVLSGLLARKLYKDGHHTLAKVVASINIAEGIGPAAFNVSVMIGG